MNWKRGLFRIWLAFSALWVSGSLGVAAYYGIGSISEFVKSLLFPPVALLFIGLLVRWILRGFSNEK
jgi:hypothetical protein